MPGGLTLLESLNADIPTPPTGKVTIYFSIDINQPAYKDDAGTVLPLGTTGATGAQGSTGPALPFPLDDGIPDFFFVPGPAGPTGASSTGSGRLIGMQVITATGAGTYTPTGGTGSVIIELIGGGGGGGGSAQPGTTNIGQGQAGSGGGYVRKRLTAGFSGAAYVVGAKGTGGAAGNNAGNNGTSTTFTETVGPTVFTAGGGTGGVGDAGSTSPRTRIGLAGGVATNGDVNVPGGPSTATISCDTAVIIGSAGGNSRYGFGGLGGTRSNNQNTSAAGTNATGFGGGGSGAVATGTGAAVAGGDGSDGIIVIYEYSS